MSEVERIYYKSGKLKSECFTINGKKEGVYKEYYKNKEIKISCIYIDGKKNGEYKKYYDKYDIYIPLSVVCLELDLMDSPNIKSNKTNFEYLESICFYTNDKKNGEYKKYSNTGELIDFHLYINDKIHGECIKYYKNGQIQEISFYNDGIMHGEYKKYYSNGYLKEIYSYNNGKKHGEYKSYYKKCKHRTFSKENLLECDKNFKGELKEIRTYVDGKLHGEYKEYYKNICSVNCDGNFKEKIKESRTYIDGYRVGEFKEYHPNGQLWKFSLYVNEKENGQTQDYYECFSEALMCVKTDTAIIGEYLEYNITGELINHYIWKNGIKQIIK